MKITTRLSKAQKELLDAMLKGTKVHFVPGMDAYCFRDDTIRRCTVILASLRKKGLVEAYNSDWRGCIYRAVRKRRK